MKSLLILAIAAALPLAALRAEPEGLGGNTGTSTLDASAAAARYESKDWKLVWSDEFNQAGIPDPSKWDYETGMVRNQEKQFYTRARKENATVQDGELHIIARREPWQGADYTSASLTTLNKFSFTYGKVEIRAQVPPGKGVWPALWTLGTNFPRVGWPACGEIDLMEFVGFQPGHLHFNVHTPAFNHVKKNQKGTRIAVPNAWMEFHTYGLVWKPEQIEWFLDGKPVFAFANDGQGPEHWPFDQPQYLLLNLAIGGTWGGAEGIDDKQLPAALRIDYVRVWSDK